MGILGIMLSLNAMAQLSVNTSVEAGYPYPIFRTSSDLDGYRIRNLINASAGGMVQLLFPNGFGIETGLRASTRGFWFKRPGSGNPVIPENVDVDISSIGIPFFVMKHTSVSIPWEPTWSYGAGLQTEWYQFYATNDQEYEGNGGKTIRSLGATAGFNYHRFGLYLTGFYALDALPALPIGVAAGISEPIALRIHSLQLSFRGYLFHKNDRQKFKF